MMDKIKSMEKAKELENEGLIKITRDNNYIYNTNKAFSIQIEELIRKRLKSKDIDIYVGEAQIINSDTIKVENKILQSDKLIIASGTKPSSLFDSCDIDAGTVAGNLVPIMNKKVCIDEIKNSLFINPTLSECFLDALIQ